MAALEQFCVTFLKVNGLCFGQYLLTWSHLELTGRTRPLFSIVLYDKHQSVSNSRVKARGICVFTMLGYVTCRWLFQTYVQRLSVHVVQNQCIPDQHRWISEWRQGSSSSSSTGQKVNVRARQAQAEGTKKIRRCRAAWWWSDWRRKVGRNSLRKGMTKQEP